MARRRWLGLGIIAAAVSLVSLTVPAATAAPAPPAHLVVIMMENNGFSSVKALPYHAQLWAHTAPGVNTLDLANSQYVCHPSAPNYEAASSGTTLCGTDNVTAGGQTQPSLWPQLQAAGVSWKVFEESMPSVCSPVALYNSTSVTGQYKIGHDPGILYSDVYGTPLCDNVVPLSSMDLNNLPQVSWITPNLCNDMHGVTQYTATKYGYANCVQATPELKTRADTWLSQEVPALVNAGATVVVTYDECCGTALGKLFTVVAGAGVANGSDASVYNHYGLLAAIENLYGLPLLGNAATATPMPLP